MTATAAVGHKLFTAMEGGSNAVPSRQTASSVPFTVPADP